MSGGFRVYDGAYPHFITSAITYWIPVFRRDCYFRLLVDSLNYCVTHRGLVVHGYVLMPDHFNALCSQTEGSLSVVIGNLKGYTAHRIVDMVRADGRSAWVAAMVRKGETGREGSVWQEGFHPEQVHSQEFFEQKLRYMHENPVRAGFVANACDWRYSSAGFYYEDRDSPVTLTPIIW